MATSGPIRKGDGVPAAPAAYEVVSVSKRYGTVEALSQVSLEVHPGESLSLVGESGSGKTTLLRSLNRMVEPEEGRVLRLGRPLTELNPVRLRRETGYVQQEGGLLPHWTVLRNAALVPRLQQREDAEELARKALRWVGMNPEGFGSRFPGELSGGQRQRVALARAIAAEPPVVLMDEPFGALDAITRAEVREAFQSLRDQLGFTVILVTHDLREAFELSDRVAVLKGGRVEALMPPEELRASPPSPYVARLLARSGLRS